MKDEEELTTNSAPHRSSFILHPSSLLPHRSRSSLRLIDDFGGKAGPTGEGVRALAQAVGGGAADAVRSSLESWTALFRRTCGQDWPRPKARLDQLARHYGVAYDPARPEIVLFALQSWYVLLVKLLVSHVATACRAGFSPPGTAPPAARAGALVESLEAGDLFAALKVTDPWRGEPFCWTVAAWSPALEWAVVQTVSRIARYDPRAIIACAADGDDLLKPLYESFFPRAVRHALGEYYTPRWLAEHVLDQVGYHGQPDSRLLDPTCGSGTFLLAALRRWRQAEKNEGGRMKDEAEVTTNSSSHPSSSHPSSFILHPSSFILRPSPSSPPPIAGFDLHPLAVASARANYLLAIADLFQPESPIDVPVFARDAILDQRSDEGVFDFVVGNPPWIAWDNLPGDYREATKPHWQRYGLFSLSGNAARHGGGKKDLSMLVLYAAADRYLRPAGRLGMVITQTLFQTKGAGDGFRRFRLGSDGPPLRVLRVDDMVEIRPFDDAANWTSVIVLQKGEPTIYPVQYVKWSRREKDEGERRKAEGKRRKVEVTAEVSPLPPGEGQGVRADAAPCSPLPAFFHREMLAQPIDPARPTSPWIIVDKDEGGRMKDEAGATANPSLHPSSFILHPSSFSPRRAEYTARLGANSGGANAVYWLEVQSASAGGVRVRNLVSKAKRRVEPVEAEIEPDLLYPLLRWADVARWSARPSAHLLLAQDPQTRTGLAEERFRRDYPRTFEYLRQFQPLLIARAAYRRYQDRQPFYSMYNVGPYTLTAAKVVWRRMDRKIRAAVVGLLDDPWLGPRPVVPQETCVFIPCASGDEAHYLCGLMNSSLVHDIVAAHSVAGGKGFGTPGILDYLPLRKFDPFDARHAELATISRRLHALTETQTPVEQYLAEVDRLAAAVVGGE